MTLQELEQYLQGNYNNWTSYEQNVDGAAQGLLGLGSGVSLNDLRLSQDLAHVPGSGSGGEAATNRGRDASNSAWSAVRQSGQPLYQDVNGQRVYMNTGWGYVDGDYVVSPGDDAPIGTYSVVGQKRGDGLTDVMLPIMAGLAGGPIAGAIAGSVEGGGGGPGFGDLLDFYNYVQDQPSGAGQTFADSQGNPSDRPPMPDQPIDGILDAIEGIVGGGDRGGINIPVPGLPFPIPGNMSWEQLMDMAKNAGTSIWEILSGGGEDQAPGGPQAGAPPTAGTAPPTGGSSSPSVPEEGSEGNWWDLDWDWWENEDERPTPGANPDAPPEEGPGTPGATTDTPGLGAGGAALALPFLFPLLQQDRKSRDPIELWDYQGPDRSYGYETPDYGTPVDRPLFDWQRQPNQPVQVAPDVQPRNPFMTPAELAMQRQRKMKEGLL